MKEKEKRALLASITPSAVQLKWQKETAFYAFIHFGMNTFTNKEWGDGTDAPELFLPTDFDANQWVETVKEAGMTGLLLTCKHHDGFCLWPSKYTDYSVKNSPWKNGEGDIVKEVSEACKKHGIKFGIYLSPWDRNQPTYASDAYNDFFIHQLTELLTNYGDIFMTWFDGANGEAENKRQVYDWTRYYDLIRRLQPECAIALCGPDVRWVGNEAAHTRACEWSVLPKSLFDLEEIREQCQSEDDEAFRQNFDATKDDLGSFEAVRDEEQFIWWPAEVDVSIRPGWFYHEKEDSCVKSVEQLMDIYFRCVGGNTSLLLNIPPNKEGRLCAVDVETLTALGKKIRQYKAHNLADNATLVASDTESAAFAIENVQHDGARYWKTPVDCEKCFITLTWQEVQQFQYIELCEELSEGQRIEAFDITCFDELGKEHFLYAGTTVGNCKICVLAQPIATKKIKIHLHSVRYQATLSRIHIT